MRWLIIIFLFSNISHAGMRDYIDRSTASLMCAKGDYAQAQKCYEQLIVDNLDSVEAKRNIADCFYEQQQYDIASDYYDQLLCEPALEVEHKEEVLFNHGCSYAQRKNTNKP